MSGAGRSRPSSVLFENHDKTITILDIPRTLEESQSLPGYPPQSRRIFSAQAIEAPFDTPDPRQGNPGHHQGGGGGGGGGGGPSNKSPALQIADLMTAAACQSALEQISDSYEGPFHLPRLVADHNTPPLPAGDAFIPDEAVPILGSLQDMSQGVREAAPKFDLVIMDPPWPNRSARRKTNSYSTAMTLADMADLLSHIPIPSHLSPTALVGVWITNRSSILDFVASPNGLFASWGLELVAEWTWLKITADGEPMFDLNSTWRKPWEKLLIAKRIGTPTPAGLVSKIILAVPDLHSRKPNLRDLFGEVLGTGLRGLEIFARNLTAGWWSWGDQVLEFQQPQYWTPVERVEFQLAFRNARPQ